MTRIVLEFEVDLIENVEVGDGVYLDRNRESVWRSVEFDGSDDLDGGV